jgi:phage tail sheath protein FI
MPFQVSPGVNITETDLTTVVPNVATSIGAIAGAFQWGPVMERTIITRESELVKVFGEPNDDTARTWFVASNYLSYASSMIVVRNVLDTARNAVVGNRPNAAGTPIRVDNGEGTSNSYDVEFGNMTDQLWVAKYPGALGNSLQIIAIDKHGWDIAYAKTASARSTEERWFISNFDRAPGTSTDVMNSGGSNDEMHVLVVDEDGLWTGNPGDILERFAYVSKASDAKRIDGSSNYVKNVLATQSVYCWLGSVTELTANAVDVSGVVAGSSKVGNTFRSFDSATLIETTPGGSLTGGTVSADTDVLTSGVLEAGFDLFREAAVVDFNIIMSGEGNTITGKHIIDNIADARKDCIACVSPNLSSVVNAGTSQLANLTTDNTTLGSSSYAIMDSAYKYQYDPYNDVFRYIPMNGDIAGLCARTDYTHDTWWSPAGLTRGTIKNIIKLSWEPTQADRDVMYQLSINPIITQRGSGVVLFGDKTMQTVPSAFDRINVRRLFIILEKAISIVAKSMLFEFNDEFTRSQFVNLIAPFLREVQGRRGVTDFKVVCDSSNNTGQIIDSNQFVGDIYIKPTRSINFIQLNFIAARSDVSFSEIGG